MLKQKIGSACKKNAKKQEVIVEIEGAGTPSMLACTFLFQALD